MAKETTYTLTFYMKSGNKIVVPHVHEYKITSDCDGVNYVSLTVEEVDGVETLLTTSLVLSEVEAVTKIRHSN